MGVGCYSITFQGLCYSITIRERVVHPYSVFDHPVKL